MVEKTVYYEDAVNDEFSGISERPKITINSSYKYINKNIFFLVARFFVYRVIMRFVARIYAFFKFRLKVEGIEKIKQFRKMGYYMYGNHTQIPGDGFIPNTFVGKKSIYFITNADNVAAKGTKTIMTMLGTIPIPTALNGIPAFTSAVSERVKKNNVVVIYPEAHIWPYCSWIRPFPEVSFRYPAKDGMPVFCFTNTYRCSKKGKPRMVTYIDGPFFSYENDERKRRNELHSLVYKAMCKRAENEDNYEFIHYKKKESMS